MRNEIIWNKISKKTWWTISELTDSVENWFIPMEDLTPEDKKLVRKYIKSEKNNY